MTMRFNFSRLRPESGRQVKVAARQSALSHCFGIGIDQLQCGVISQIICSLRLTHMKTRILLKPMSTSESTNARIPLSGWLSSDVSLDSPDSGRE